MSFLLCEVHGKPLDQYWFCEQFWTCADALYDYVCHDASVCTWDDPDPRRNCQHDRLPGESEEQK